MLQPNVPIVSVEILNPLIGKDRSEEKIVVLDVLARDAEGRLFNVEIQTRIPLSFPSRLLYYNSKNYVRQIKEGDGYEKLRPAISICMLDRRMFSQPSEQRRWHHSFRLRCDQNMELVLTDNFEFHIFELPKFEPASDDIGELPAPEKWLYLLTHAAEMEPQALADELGEPPYREAIGVLEMISKSPEDLQYYEDRLKFLRDERGKLDAARQEGEQIGVTRGRQEGRKEGQQEGKLAGKIQTLQEFLGDQVSTDEELLQESQTVLAAHLQRLRDRLSNRRE